MTIFTLNGVLYKTNDKGNYFYKSTGNVDKNGYPLMMRIGKHVWEQAFDEYVNTAHMDEGWDIEDEIEDRKQKEIEDAKETEDNFNKKGTDSPKKEKKASKPRRSKNIAFEGHGITLTAKQVDFIKLLPTTNFWENGLDSALWCDCIADDIGWNPMSVGAMISTLREKKLVVVMPQKVNGKKCKSMELTELGRQVAINLGLK